MSADPTCGNTAATTNTLASKAVPIATTVSMVGITADGISNRLVK